MNRSIISASFWSILSELIAKVISPISFLILTRLLSPNDFGIVAVASTILNFIYIINDLGIAKVLIQYPEEDVEITKIYNVGFWFNIFFGFLLFVSLIIFSHDLAIFFGEKKSKDVIIAMSFQVIFYSLSTVQIAIKKKNLDFKFLFYIRILTVSIPLLISVPLAFVGYGYWAIVIGQILASAASTLTFWIITDWKPTFYFNLKLLNKIISKSIFSSIEQLSIWILVGLDTYLISNKLGSYYLGIYTTSKTLFNTAITLTLGAIIPVLYSSFSKISKNILLLKRNLLFAQKIIFSLAVFMGLFVFTFKISIENILFNDKWSGINEIFGLMFLILSLEFFSTPLVEAIRSKGLFKILALNNIFFVLISIPFLFISINYGLKTYVIIRCILLFTAYPIIYIYSKKYLNISFVETIKNVKTEIYIFLSLFILS